MRFNDQDIQLLVKQSGLGEKAVRRLAASVKVRNSGVGDVESGGRLLDLGLRLEAVEYSSGGRKVLLLKELCAALQSYQKVCPVIVGWVGRGDFNPAKLPHGVTPARLLHACRTAGRLRAEVLRSLS